jgi:hydrogenase maturation factor
LLFAAPSEKADKILEDLYIAGLQDSRVIGFVSKQKEKLLYINN